MNWKVKQMLKLKNRLKRAYLYFFPTLRQSNYAESGTISGGMPIASPCKDPANVLCNNIARLQELCQCYVVQDACVSDYTARTLQERWLSWPFQPWVHSKYKPVAYILDGNMIIVSPRTFRELTLLPK